MKVQFVLAAAVLLSTALVAAAFAGNSDRIGTAGASELLIPNSPRGLAIGDGAVADWGGLEMLYWNPAAISGVRGVEALFSNLTYIADMKKNYVGVAAQTSFGTIAVTADVLSIGDIIETTELAPEGTGRVFSPNFSILGLSYGRYMTDQVTIGLTGKLISESVLQAHASGVAFDIGIQYRPGPKGVSFGLALKNIGPTMRFSGADFESFHRTSDNPQAGDRSLSSLSAPFELPSYIEFGGRYEYPLTDIGMVAGYGSFQSNNFNDDEVNLGAEFAYHDQFFVRGGGTLSGNDDYLYGPAFGLGVALPLGGQSKLNFDYALRLVNDFFDDNHMVGVKFNF
ncbi:MAG: PorV/PorQ family protein [Candidatus Eisenbacteria bacterium]|nr:PorV/PorQ family protein [Candidatus Eisenbacteria bacterium]